MESSGFTQQFRPLGYKETYQESLNLNLMGLSPDGFINVITFSVPLKLTLPSIFTYFKYPAFT